MIVAAIALLVLLQVPPPVPQSPANQPVKPSGRIAGHVTDAVSGKPIVDATVRLVRWEGGLGRPSPPGRSNEQGAFEFKELVAGSYQLTVAAERYVGLEFGQKVPWEPGRRIELADSQQFDKADLPLPRTSAVEGRLTDEFGDPMPGVTVQIARVQFVAGKRRLLPISAAANVTRPTDDLGRFRVYNLPPGDYYVLALSGPFAGADDPSGFAPTYYPGTRVATQAQAVHVGVAQDLADISFPLAPAAMGTVSGSVVDKSGQAQVGSTVMLFQTTGGDVRALISARIATEADGAFAFRNVAAGSYVVQAWGRPQGGGNLGRAPFGSLALDVPEGGARDLVIAVGGATLKGHISFEGTAAIPSPNVVLVSPAIVDFVSGPAGGGPPPTVTHDDWTFEVNNMSGRRVIWLAVGSPAWILKRATLDGKDVTDEPLDFSKGDVDGLEITLTSNVATIAGTVTDNGAPATGYGVLVFAEDSTKWAFPSRFVAAAGANQTGGFRVTGLPAGAYRVVALPASEIADAQDPEVLTKLVVFATSVLVGEGETQTVALKLVRR